MRNSSMKIKIPLIILIILGLVFSGTTGKISGKIIDGRSGEPLVGCNIMIVNSDMGTATDLSGDYAILNIHPGVVDVKAMMIGYESVIVTDVAVGIDKTTRIDLELNVQAIEGSAVTVVAQTKIIQFDVTNSEARITGSEIDAMPVSDVHDVIKLQGGVTQDAGGGIHIRGGRSSEIVYMVDGVSLTDVYDGALSVPVENSNIQELQVISGTFNAEYGRAMSGIINIVTKDGGNDFSFGIKMYSGDKISNNPIYNHVSTYNAGTDRDIEIHANGPIVKNLLSFYSSGRYYSSDGWLGGIDTFTMYGDSIFHDYNGNLVRDLAEPFDDINSNGMWDIDEVFSDLGNDAFDENEPFLDCGVDGLCSGDAGYLGPDYGENNDSREIFEPFTDLGNGEWDDGEPLKTPQFKAMNWREKWSLQNKLTYRLSSMTKFRLNTIFSREKYQNYDHNRQMNQDGRNTDYSEGEFIGFNISHSFSSKTFFDIDISQNRKKFESYLFKDPTDPRYSTPAGFQEIEGDIFPKSVMQQWADNYDFLTLSYAPQESFSRWGISRNRFMRETISKQYKFDLTSQVNNYHQVKLGIDYQDHRLELDDYSLIDSYWGDVIYTALEPELINIPQALKFLGLEEIHGDIPSWIEFWNPSRSYYLNKPKEFSAYIQDKIEYGDMILNFGIRYDYFDPNSFVPTNPHEPYLFNPRNPMLDSLLSDDRINELLNISWGDTSHYVVSIDGLDTTYYTYADYGDYPDQETFEDKKGWFKRTTKKSLISPRLGVAYPISDKGVIHFSYGYFFQIPNFELLFTNPGYKMTETGSTFGIYGNPDLKPQKTLSYELGLQQELIPGIKLEVTGYYRDVRDWVATGIPITLTTIANYYTYVNKDYSNVRGVIFTLFKLYSEHYSWHIDYTFQVAEGSNSAPDEEWGSVESDTNDEPKRMIIPLDWDQSHTLNANLFVGNDNSGATLLFQFGSGYPYTPEFVQGVSSGQNIATSLPQNSRRKPMSINFDLKLYRDIYIKQGGRGRIFMNIQNIFDTKNENTVYGDTGRAGKTIYEANAILREQGSPEPLRPNTIQEYYNRPDWYSTPRNIQFGIELSW